MATKQKAQITTATTVQWSNGDPFNGFLLLGLVLPTGYAQASLEDSDRHVRVPLWSPITIRNGVLDTQAKVWFNESLVPPGTNYVAFWYDSNAVFLDMSAITNFEVDEDPYTIVPPTLNAPSAATGIPVPDSAPSVSQTVVVVGGTPIIEVPLGDIDGMNDQFTIEAVPSSFLLVLNGRVLTAGVGYTRSGVNITMGGSYIPQTGDTLLAVYWV